MQRADTQEMWKGVGLWTVGTAVAVGVTAAAIYGVCSAFMNRYEFNLAKVLPADITKYEGSYALRRTVYDLRNIWRWERGKLHKTFESFWKTVEGSGSYYADLADHAAALGTSMTEVRALVELGPGFRFPRELNLFDPRPFQANYVLGAVFSSIGIFGVASGAYATFACCVACQE